MTESFIDLRLPRPLARPELWPALNSRDEKALLDLRAACLSGGALRVYFRQALESGRVSWLNATVEAIGSLKPSEQMVIRASSKEWLEHVNSEILNTDRLSHVSRLHMDWARECFPTLSREVGELTLRRWVQDYEKSLGHEISWYEDLGFFAKFIAKFSGQDQSEKADLEYSRVQVLFSPQEDVGEDAGGRGSKVRLSNTLVVLQNSRQMTALWRRGQQCAEHVLNWQEALAIDEVKDDGEIELTRLVAILEEKAPAVSMAMKSSFESASARNLSFQNVVNQLLELGILRRT